MINAFMVSHNLNLNNEIDKRHRKRGLICSENENRTFEYNQNFKIQDSNVIVVFILRNHDKNKNYPLSSARKRTGNT